MVWAHPCGAVLRAAIEVPGFGAVDSSCVLSPCQRYRYALTRRWSALLPLVGICGLNPSTASHEVQDNTIRRCMGFAKAWGFGGLLMFNLFNIRTSKPVEMRRATDPVGERGDEAVLFAARNVTQVVCAWGTTGCYRERDKHVTSLLKRHGYELHVIQLTKSGFPQHPLYLGADLRPQPWDGPERCT